MEDRKSKLILGTVLPREVHVVCHSRVDGNSRGQSVRHQLIDSIVHSDDNYISIGQRSRVLVGDLTREWLAT